MRKRKGICMLIPPQKNTAVLLHLQRDTVWGYMLIWSIFHSFMPHWSHMLHRLITFTTGMWYLLNCNSGITALVIGPMCSNCICPSPGALSCHCSCIYFNHLFKMRTFESYFACIHWIEYTLSMRSMFFHFWIKGIVHPKMRICWTHITLRLSKM